MTLRRATLYIGAGTLLVAWLASAASVPPPPDARVEQRAAPTRPAATDGVAAQVQEQTRRLKARLASAPAPQRPLRNPFAFRPAAAPEASPVAVLRPPVPPASPAFELPPSEPRLELVGVAEDRGDDGPVRTAMIATDTNDLLLARTGAAVAGRYRVAVVHADAVDLVDVTTGLTRRLSLQPQ